MFVAAKTEDGLVAAKILDFVAATELSPTSFFATAKVKLLLLKSRFAATNTNVNRVATILCSNKSQITAATSHYR